MLLRIWREKPRVNQKADVYISGRVVRTARGNIRQVCWDHVLQMRSSVKLSPKGIDRMK